MGSGASSNSKSEGSRAGSYVPDYQVHKSDIKECKQKDTRIIESSNVVHDISTDADFKSCHKFVVESEKEAPIGCVARNLEETKMGSDSRGNEESARVRPALVSDLTISASTKGEVNGEYDREGVSVDKDVSVAAVVTNIEQEYIEAEKEVQGEGERQGHNENENDQHNDEDEDGDGDTKTMRSRDGLFNANYFGHDALHFHQYHRDTSEHDSELDDVNRCVEQDEDDGNDEDGRRYVDLAEDEVDGAEDDMDSEAERNADLFAYSAMSLGIESDELLFNMLYFGTGSAGAGEGGGEGGSDDVEGDGSRNSDDENDVGPMITASALRTLLNSTVEETIAAHSANNTPYKLRPACDADLNSLVIKRYGVPPGPGDCDSSDCGEGEGEGLDDSDCLVCSEMLERGCETVALPACGHVFHAHCIMKWLKLQSWCPVCRTSVAGASSGVSGVHAVVSDMRLLAPVEEERRKEAMLIHLRGGNSSPGPGSCPIFGAGTIGSAGSGGSPGNQVVAKGYSETTDQQGEDCSEERLGR